MPVTRITLPDATELAEAAALHIADSAGRAINERGLFHIALAGGSTPEQTYRELGSRVTDWSRWRFYFSDERFVPYESSESNYGMAVRSFIEKAKIPTEYVFGVNTNLSTAADAAEDYEIVLQKHVGLTEGDIVRLDMILLGLGSDGHTASLFPGMPSLQEKQRWVVASAHGVLPPPVERVTFTYPLINAAREVMFLVSGSGKHSVWKQIEAGEGGQNDLPALGVQPAAGELTWMLDYAAAGC